MRLPVMKRAKLFISISVLVIVVGIISLAVQGLNLGIDFTGGTLLDLQFQKPVTTAQITDVLADYKLEKGSKVQEMGGNRILIRTHTFDSEQQRTEILNSLKAKVGNFEVMRIDKVDAVIGKELTQKALWALLLAALGMVAYISYRFEFKFAVTAVLALLHDAVIVIGIFSLLQLEIDSSFVAAILTIIGYSINDTIVVFDRIRENLRARRRLDFDKLVDDSVNETLTRSINTSLTTLLVVFALIFFGGETIRNFMLALAIGILSGTYSSIFVASPVWAYWRKATDRKGKKPVAA